MKLVKAAWPWSGLGTQLYVLGLLLVAACSGGGASPAGMAVDGGGSIVKWMQQQGASAVVIVDPSDCLSCDPRLHGVKLAVDRNSIAGRHPVRFLLTRRPSDFQRKQLVLQGLRSLPVLAQVPQFPDTFAVHVARLVGGEVVVSSLSDSATRSFLRSLLATPQIPAESVSPSISER